VDKLLAFRITSLHAQTVLDTDSRLRYRRKELDTGTILAHLDPNAVLPDNFGLINVTTGAIKIRWAVVATLSFLIDASAQGLLPDGEDEPVRLRFEESGKVTDNGFRVRGSGEILPGSIFAGSSGVLCANFCELVSGDGTFLKKIATGRPVKLAFVPKSSTLDLKFPSQLGGGTHKLNLMGGFSLLRIMTLP
jgi:hypothetical protein